MGKALRLLNLQKDLSDYTQELIDNYDFAIATAPYSTLSTPEKFVIARTYLF
jgi:hypothetical protein